MRWEKVEAVQPIDALLLTGVGASERLADALAAKAPFYRSLPRAQGEDWVALFARPLPGEGQGMVPKIEGAISLYKAEQGWFFPVGCALAVPQDVRSELLAQLAREASSHPPAIIVPRFEAQNSQSAAVDIYPVRLPSEAIRA